MVASNTGVELCPREESVSAFVFSKRGQFYIYIVWPDWEGSDADGICDAILAHASCDDIELTIDDAWMLMKKVREAANEGDFEY